jgi:hypothetical protein
MDYSNSLTTSNPAGPGTLRLMPRSNIASQGVQDMKAIKNFFDVRYA